MKIITELDPYIEQQDNGIRPLLNLAKCVTITFWKIVTSGSLCSTANQFGMGKSIFKVVFWDMYLVIQDVLANCAICFINLPKFIAVFLQVGFPTALGPSTPPTSKSSA